MTQNTNSPLLRHNFKYLSGIKPTGELTIGNYLGVIKPAVQLSNTENVLMFIADMHAFTVPQSSKEVRRHTLEIIKIFNMYNLHFFIQSHIPEHNQLGYIMEYVAKDWQLRNQIQYKEKKNKDTRVSLLTYPALMAADCLLYDIDNILIGEDQMSHIHLMNDLIESFESEFGVGVLNKPVGFVGDFPKIKDLRDPGKKMSKSNGDEGCISLFDKPEDAYNKIIHALTDSYNNVKWDPEKQPGISNLLNIYHGLTDIAIEIIQSKYVDLLYPYATFKMDLAMIVRNFLVGFQKNYADSSSEIDKGLELFLKSKAELTMLRVKNAIGLK
jgi:tryptophanyl-tRNA synthetase